MPRFRTKDEAVPADRRRRMGKRATEQPVEFWTPTDEAALTTSRRPSQIAKVREHLTQAVLRAIERAPSSQRQLAREAGISDVLLVQLRRGDFQATKVVANKIAEVLEKWGVECRVSAREIREAGRRVPTPRTRGKS